VLHETFLKLDRVGQTNEIRSPADYIFRTAINVAHDQRRANNQGVSAAEIDALLDIADDQPDPAAQAEARSDVKALLAAMEQLPSRPREVFYRIAVTGCAGKEVAESLGVTTRTVEADFRLALMHCADHLGHVLGKRSAGPRRRY
jgi:RNA polymerase sigma-70 factor (ECF subfamily)